MNQIVSKAYAGLNGTGNLNIYKGLAAGNIKYKSNDRAYYGDFYSATFQANSEWEMIDMPFDTFERKRYNAPKLDPKDIRSIAIVAYGRDFISDVSVSNIIFYY